MRGRRGKKDPVRSEFCAISREVYALGRDGLADDAASRNEKSGSVNAYKKFGDLLWASLPNQDVNRKNTMATRRNPIPLPMYRNAMRNRAREAEKKRLEDLASGMDTAKEIKARKKREEMAEKDALHRRQLAGNHTGIHGIGDGTRGLRPTGIGSYRDGMLTISEHDVERLSGKKRPRSGAAESAKAPPAKKKVGWKRKGKGKKNKK